MNSVLFCYFENNRIIDSNKTNPRIFIQFRFKKNKNLVIGILSAWSSSLIRHFFFFFFFITNSDLRYIHIYFNSSRDNIEFSHQPFYFFFLNQKRRKKTRIKSVERIK